jgi:hypothetical protein
MHEVHVNVNGHQMVAGGIQPGEPVKYWNEPGEHHMFNATSFDGESMAFYTYGAAEWWLTCLGHNRLKN